MGRDTPTHFCSRERIFSKIVSPVGASKRSTNDACAPMLTASSGLVSTHAYASTAEVPLADTIRSIEASRFRNTVEDAIPPHVDGPMSTRGVRRPVMLTDAEPASVMLGPAETVTTLVA